MAGAFELPEEALVGQSDVFVINDGRARQRKVSLVAPQSGPDLGVRELVSGDQVIATRLPGIGNGLRVRTAPDSQ